MISMKKHGLELGIRFHGNGIVTLMGSASPYWSVWRWCGIKSITNIVKRNDVTKCKRLWIEMDERMDFAAWANRSRQCTHTHTCDNTNTCFLGIFPFTFNIWFMCFGSGPINKLFEHFQFIFRRVLYLFKPAMRANWFYFPPRSKRVDRDNWNGQIGVINCW